MILEIHYNFGTKFGQRVDEFSRVFRQLPTQLIVLSIHRRIVPNTKTKSFYSSQN